MKKIIIVLGIICLIFDSCTQYDDFTEDFDKTIVYFGTQKPLRTIVAYNEMKFKVGVAVGGKRSNDKDEFADFVIDPTLLTKITGANVFTLLPQNYYTLSNGSKMVIPKGSFIGDVTVALNRDLFTNDPLALNKTYALPIKITATSLDSIAAGKFDAAGNVITAPKDYTILVVKYISPYTGTFYRKGKQQELGVNGVVVNEIVYSNSDLIKNQTWDITTIDRNSVRTPGIGTVTNQNFAINVNEADNTVTIDSPSAGVSNLIGFGTYDVAKRTFFIEYRYTFGGKNFKVIDELIVRRPPEQDLSFEIW
jgi:hypothetical protein